MTLLHMFYVFFCLIWLPADLYDSVVVSSAVVSNNSTTFSTETLNTTANEPFICAHFFLSCNNHGVCFPPIYNITENVDCKCDSGYVTFECPPSIQCCYKQELRFEIVVLTLFFGLLGVPYFILGSVGLGVGILIPSFCGLCCVKISKKRIENQRIGEKEATDYCINIIGKLMISVSFIWWLVVLIMLAAGIEKINDKNGVPIGPWL